MSFTTSSRPSAPIEEERSARVVIAPDAFKGTASAEDAAQWLGEGVREIIRDAEVLLAPMADGGEGTSTLFEGERITLPTTDAAGRLTEASYTYDAATTTAFIDVAAASGLPAVADSPVVMTGDTYGTGVLIADAQTRGATRIVLGLGGSATVDGGTGILVALGANPLNAAGYQLTPGGGHLREIADLDTAKVNIPAGAVDWVLLTDTSAPACGADGAAAVFGPQKGASPADVAVLDEGLATLCDVAGIDPNTPGLGAAGGVGIGITWLSTLLHGNTEHVSIQPGARVVAQANGVVDALQDASLVITGEGAFDSQTATGKVVGTLCDLVAEHNPQAVVAIAAGAFNAEVPKMAGVDPIAVTLSDSTDVREQLIQAGREIAVAYLNISTIQG
ncbi:glycerate kinase family protein [Corynebacterium riegelii]|uniref:glycerate kinase family protein n=1 Tax=Corynebacterium riegelii TaxID=156976 RepID=UPI00191F347B|nr:glycerate kinase [Corynebacterium riegelii]QQU83836.1 glycerate kinase [Corynebacterium riegelii]